MIERYLRNKNVSLYGLAVRMVTVRQHCEILKMIEDKTISHKNAKEVLDIIIENNLVKLTNLYIEKFYWEGGLTRMTKDANGKTFDGNMYIIGEHDAIL